MNIISDINLVTVLIACVFIFPILAGILRPFTNCRVYRFFALIINCGILITSLILSVIASKGIMSGYENFVLTFFYNIIPGFRDAVMSKEIWLYPVFITILTALIYTVLRLLLFPVFKYAISPLSEHFANRAESMNGAARRTLGGFSQLPASFLFVLVLSLLLYFYTCFFSGPAAADYINGSSAYMAVKETIIEPPLETSVIKDIGNLLDDSLSSQRKGLSSDEDKKRLAEYLKAGALKEAVKSNDKIDIIAKDITKTQSADREKAFMIYLWISRNIKYDEDKAVIVRYYPSDVESGALVAYNKKKGVCFDFSSLYVAMCRSAGLKVRMLTGYGYTGTKWVDHVWNQVYDPDTKTWIDVDTTFGTSGVIYFRSPFFAMDHREGVVQGEW